MWIVYATPPRNLQFNWDFRANFFPRQVAYKKDAEILAKEAKEKGGINVRIEKGK